MYQVISVEPFAILGRFSSKEDANICAKAIRSALEIVQEQLDDFVLMGSDFDLACSIQVEETKEKE